MMYKSTDPTERFKDLTNDQMIKLDQYALRLLTGEEVMEPAEFYKIKKENEALKDQLGAINASGFDMVA